MNTPNNHIDTILIACSIILLVLVITPFIKKFALATKWVDQPDKRKNHKKVTAYLGGTAIYISFIGYFSYLILSEALSYSYFNAIIALSILFLTGIIDDKYPIRASIKLVIQCIAICLMASIHENISFLFFLLIYLPIGILIINAYNLIDGRDGLAIGIASLNSVPLALIFFLNQDFSLLILTMVFTCSLCGLIPYNLFPAKIFLGDGGSLLIGGVFLFLYNQAVPYQNFQINNLQYYIPIIISLPVLDTIAVIIYRKLKNLPIMKADRNHIHHLIEKKDFSHSDTVQCIHLIAFTINLIWIGLILFSINLFNILFIIPIICLGYFYLHRKNDFFNLPYLLFKNLLGVQNEIFILAFFSLAINCLCNIPHLTLF